MTNARTIQATDTTAQIASLAEPGGVGAAFVSTSFSRSATNRRRLQVQVRLAHRASIEVTVSRMDRLLGRGDSGSVAAGSRTVVVPITRAAPRGEAMVTVVVMDEGGRSQSFRRLVSIPARILS